MVTEIALVHVYHVFLGLSYADMRARGEFFLDMVGRVLCRSSVEH